MSYDAILRTNWLRVHKSILESSTDDNHSEPVNSDSGMSLSALGSVVATVLDGPKFISARIEDVHSAEHLAFLVQSSVQVDPVVARSNRVV